MLTSVDASEMLSLAQLTKLGPFAGRTNELGRFLGVRREGRLVAMAGERMRSPSSPRSAACALTRVIAGRGMPPG